MTRNKKKKYLTYISLALSLLLLGAFIYNYNKNKDNYREVKFDKNIDMIGDKEENEVSNETIRVKKEKKIEDVSKVIRKDYERDVVSNYEEGTEQIPSDEVKSEEPPPMTQLPPPTTAKDAITIVPPTEKVEVDDKVVATSESGYKRGLQQELFSKVGEIKTNPTYTQRNYMMSYYSKSELEMYANSLVQSYIDNLCLDNNSEVEREFYFEGKHYRITVIDTWKIAIDNDSVRGVLNAVKIGGTGFIQATHRSDDEFSYQYGAVSIYYDKDIVKNVVTMALYNFAELE